ncbi:Deoxyribonuclease Tat-D [Lachnellula occidentalis]|uniref:Deoxyribonuclease Tat-D n=1 Tax=Lachnellula occidentalis TaxID=215460 RepID=A0A8H8UK66_9HELO|nr:Deoxyribonuclease Tat-D [Lachnellula occidentalis]
MASTTTNPASSANPAPAHSSYKPRYIDIGINLTDPVYTGLYHGTQRHPPDLPAVVSRALDAGCKKLIVTGSDMAESKKAIQLAKEYRTVLLPPRRFAGVIYTTVGVHPCSCSQFTTSLSPSTMLTELHALALRASQQGHCVAFGEIGLDYDRLSLCPKETQLQYFAAQLDIACSLSLPLFLHSRAAHVDFFRLLDARKDKLPRRGVVHSFTGTQAEMLELVAGGWYIGVNGCSLKSAENVQVVRAIPLDRLMLETDGPWCEIRASHAGAGFVKGYEEEEEGWM